MLEPIPAIDIIDGQCVRLSKGRYDTKTVYNENPVDVALQFEALGFQRLHVVDLDGAKSSHVVNLSVLKELTSKTKLHIDFGGGIKTDDDIKAVFQCGAEFVTIGSIAVKNPQIFEHWIETYGPKHIILGADVKDGYISINGWRECSDIPLFEFLDTYLNKGIKYILCTDISKDGMLKGTSVELYTQIMQRYPHCKLIASGGVSCMQDLTDLDAAKVPHVVFGKAIYENRIDMKEVAQRFIHNR
ncbi:MAG: 1-(5-phosphoribosyl)-5-[(5-phosphoribosylamino)methylideneamino]imidazole-4-carboxamide isomerase [Bacteroidaceae bacterium]|nr:1-(5-phosphoribosyl)-5-[(5-phosphoribosylamino)methylideneamino]imidazole-4-carboxamide isomerase [Bacteroidaceae bacterium]